LEKFEIYIIVYLFDEISKHSMDVGSIYENQRFTTGNDVL